MAQEHIIYAYEIACFQASKRAYLRVTSTSTSTSNMRSLVFQPQNEHIYAYEIARQSRSEHIYAYEMACFQASDMRL